MSYEVKTVNLGESLVWPNLDDWPVPDLQRHQYLLQEAHITPTEESLRQKIEHYKVGEVYPAHLGLTTEVKRILESEARRDYVQDLLGVKSEEEAFAKLVSDSTFRVSRHGRMIFYLAHLEVERLGLLDIANRYNAETDAYIGVRVSDDGQAILATTCHNWSEDQTLWMKEPFQMDVAISDQQKFHYIDLLEDIVIKVGEARYLYITTTVKNISKAAEQGDTAAQQLMELGLDGLRDNLEKIFSYAQDSQALQRKESEFGLEPYADEVSLDIAQVRKSLVDRNLLSTIDPKLVTELVGVKNPMSMAKATLEKLADKIYETHWLKFCRHNYAHTPSYAFQGLKYWAQQDGEQLVPTHTHAFTSDIYPPLDRTIAENRAENNSSLLRDLIASADLESIALESIDFWEGERALVATKIQELREGLKSLSEATSFKEVWRTIKRLSSQLPSFCRQYFQKKNMDERYRESLTVARDYGIGQLKLFLRVFEESISECDRIISKINQSIEIFKNGTAEEKISALSWSPSGRRGSFCESLPDSDHAFSLRLQTPSGELLPERISFIENPLGRVEITSYADLPWTDLTRVGDLKTETESLCQYRVGQLIDGRYEVFTNDSFARLEEGARLGYEENTISFAILKNIHTGQCYEVFSLDACAMFYHFNQKYDLIKELSSIKGIDFNCGFEVINGEKLLFVELPPYTTREHGDWKKIREDLVDKGMQDSRAEIAAKYLDSLRFLGRLCSRTNGASFSKALDRERSATKRARQAQEMIV